MYCGECIDGRQVAMDLTWSAANPTPLAGARLWRQLACAFLRKQRRQALRARWTGRCFGAGR